MDLQRDPESGGTDENGEKITRYCSFCYQNGDFVHPNITVKEMQIYAQEVLNSLGVPKPIAWLYTRGIPKLARWQMQRNPAKKIVNPPPQEPDDDEDEQRDIFIR